VRQRNELAHEGGFLFCGRISTRGVSKEFNGAVEDCPNATRSPLGPPCPEHRRQGAARANRTAADLAPVIAELRTAGVTSLKAIATALDERHGLRRAAHTGTRPKSRGY
jgi:hypothetical protein